ncbi:MAG: rhamnulokinase [Clostridia bacterium]|nr:rhamnulokinase [Clostridia bacterium]
MTTKYFLAIDMGASSGRHILGHIENGQIILEEMYRFPYGATEKNGHMCWDTEHLWNSIVNGMKACAAAGKIPVSVSVDTWGVDNVLLDKDGNVIGDTIAYRDSRTDGMPEKLEETLPFSEHYAKAGIARQIYNTVYQLMAVSKADMDKTETILMIPDYFHYLLSGVKATEYTHASTSGLLNAETRTWDKDILAAAGIPERLFLKPSKPGTILGNLRPEVAEAVGFDCKVVLPASHDTGSAYMAVPARNENSAYLSSGTWSLIGVENDKPITSQAAMDAGFTNEGGYNDTYRVLKNIMGLWMLQCIRHELDDKYSFAEMAQMAANAPEVSYRVDVSDNRYLAPKSMIAELQKDVQEQGGEPLSNECLLRLVNLSLADGYAQAVDQIETFTGKHYDTINIVGGGSQNVVLNQMTANASKRTVIAGPTEGTALGNIMAQMIADGTLKDLAEARKVESASFPLNTYLPQ